MEIEQMRIRMGEMAAEIERLNSAWQVETLNRKDLIIAKQESENDRLKAENARLQSIIDSQSPAVAVPDYKEELFQLRKKAENLSTKLGFIASVINSRKISLSTKEREFPHLLIERLHTDSELLKQRSESPRITEHVAVPDHCLKKQNLPIEKLLEQYTHEGCDFTDIKWVNAASLRYVESMEDSQIKCLICSLINLQSPRITDKDAGEILLSYGVEYLSVLSWIESKGRALLKKLNEANHETN